MIWSISTPVICLDQFTCTAHEYNGTALQEVASEELILDRITGLFLPAIAPTCDIFCVSKGVGLSLPDNVFGGAVPNNSVIVVSSEDERPQELICHSGLKAACRGQWLVADDPQDPEDTGAQDQVDSANSTGIFNFVKLDVGAISRDGVYSCIIKDEEMQYQSLFVAIYHSGIALGSTGMQGQDDMLHMYSSPASLGAFLFPDWRWPTGPGLCLLGESTHSYSLEQQRHPAGHSTQNILYTGGL